MAARPFEHYREVAERFCGVPHPGAFYGAVDGRQALGAGLIYTGVPYPRYNEELGRYEVRRGLVYVVTHECDVEQENARAYNDYAVICPIVPLRTLFETYVAAQAEERLQSLFRDLAADNIQRLQYLPACPALLNIPGLTEGAYMYLNHLCSTHVSQFGVDGAGALCAVSWDGLRAVDAKLQNQFFRPKDDPLPRTR